MSDEEKEEVDDEEENLPSLPICEENMMKRNFTIEIKMAFLPMRRASG